jgi:hypothetical protein
MKYVLLAAVLVVVLGGCGASHDPFVGTWVAVRNGPASVLISKEGSRYLAVEYLGHGPVEHLVYTRQGDHLVAVVQPKLWPKCGADLDPTTGILRLTPFGYVLKRVTNNTTSPYPTP